MLASTLDEYSRLLCSPFPPSSFFLVVATRWWIPGARCHPVNYYYHPEGAYYYVEPADDQE